MNYFPPPESGGGGGHKVMEVGQERSPQYFWSNFSTFQKDRKGDNRERHTPTHRNIVDEVGLVEV